MHTRDEIVPFKAFDTEICTLERRLAKGGFEVPADSAFGADARRAFATLYYSVFVEDRPPTLPADTGTHGAALAGLGDMAMKLNRAMDLAADSNLLLHIASMLKGSVRMNTWSGILDDAANKTSELYIGALAIGAGYEVELEDPVNSADGKNPDVLLRRAGKGWSIAVKTPQSDKPRSIWGNIEGAVKQIERSGRPGIPLINLKNAINRDSLEAGSPYTSIAEATDAVHQASGAVIDAVRAQTVDSEWEELFDDKLACPLVAYMTQVTVTAVAPDGQHMFVPIRELRLRPHPPCRAGGLSELSGLNAEARDLVSELNEQLQANPSSPRNEA